MGSNCKRKTLVIKFLQRPDWTVLGFYGSEKWAYWKLHRYHCSTSYHVRHFGEKNDRRWEWIKELVQKGGSWHEMRHLRNSLVFLVSSNPIYGWICCSFSLRSSIHTPKTGMHNTILSSPCKTEFSRNVFSSKINHVRVTESIPFQL